MSLVRHDQPDGTLDAWYCVRTQPKHEQIAATHLRREGGLEVFAPKLKTRKATRRGAVWFIEALFPGYIFARFNWVHDGQRVKGSRGVSTVVSFSCRPPVVPEDIITSLRSEFDQDEVHEVPETLNAGQTIMIAGGAFHGLQATVLRVMDPPTRVHILLDMLGGATRAEISIANIAIEGGGPLPDRLKLTA